MGGKKDRHLTMKALISGSTYYGRAADLNHVDTELTELGRCNRLQPVKRQRLLQILHATRALDTCLHAILSINGKIPQHSIGPMLHQLKALPPHVRGYLDDSTVRAFVASISRKRNLYVHRAASFPSSTQEVERVLSEIDACLTRIL